MRLMSADPGGTSGICFASDEGYVNMQIRARYQIGGQHHVALRNMLNDWAPDRVINEMFRFRQSKRKIVLDSVEYIGVMKLWCQDNGVPYIEQTVMSGK